MSTWGKVLEWICITIKEQWAKEKEYNVNVRVNVGLRARKWLTSLAKS